MAAKVTQIIAKCDHLKLIVSNALNKCDGTENIINLIDYKVKSSFIYIALYTVQSSLSVLNSVSMMQEDNRNQH